MDLGARGSQRARAGAATVAALARAWCGAVRESLVSLAFPSRRRRYSVMIWMDFTFLGSGVVLET